MLKAKFAYLQSSVAPISSLYRGLSADSSSLTFALTERGRLRIVLRRGWFSEFSQNAESFVITGDMYQLIFLTSLCLSVDAKCSQLIVRSANTEVGHPLKSVDELMSSKFQVLKKVNNSIPLSRPSKASIKEMHNGASLKEKLLPDGLDNSFSMKFNNTLTDFSGKQWTSVHKLSLPEIVRSTAFCMVGLSTGCTLYLIALLIQRLMSTDEALEKIREDIASAPTSEHEASKVSQDVKKEQPQLVNVRAKKKNKHKKN
uniref:Uncharacterized protein n=1 Tax=Ascaris lumbricoides TaxID=6252 RepID=A0A0M3HT55_ASCLU